MLLVTTSKSVLLFEDSGCLNRIIETGHGLYYGIARRGAEFFIAARNRMVSSGSPVENERGEIRVFDESFKYIKSCIAPFPLRDIHQITFVGTDLFVSCSFDNMIAIQREGGLWEKWYPLDPPQCEPLDINHFNSISCVDGMIILVAHNHASPSEILFFDKASLKLLDRKTLGRQSHNFWRFGNEYFTCSSGEGALISLSGFKLDTGEFPRGYAVSDDGKNNYIGLSKISERENRDFVDGAILIFDEKWNSKGKFELLGEGLVLDILYFNE